MTEGRRGANILEGDCARSRALNARPERIVRADVRLMQLLEAARGLNLPQWRVVAGCVYQTVWNTLTGRTPGADLNDNDLIYFDSEDLSQETEVATARRLRDLMPTFAGFVEVSNQARVHLWFEDYFGIYYPRLSSADEAITRYASTTHAVGVRLTSDHRLDIFAPFGLDDIFTMIVRGLTTPCPIGPLTTEKEPAPRRCGLS